MNFITLSIESNGLLNNRFQMKYNMPTIYLNIKPISISFPTLLNIKCPVHISKYIANTNNLMRQIHCCSHGLTKINQPDKEKNYLIALQDIHNDIRFRNGRLYLQSKAHSELLL